MSRLVFMKVRDNAANTLAAEWWNVKTTRVLTKQQVDLFATLENVHAVACRHCEQIDMDPLNAPECDELQGAILLLESFIADNDFELTTIKDAIVALEAVHRERGDA